MRVLLAQHLGFCFGVRDALMIAESTDRPDLVTIHGELVHNEAVLHRLDELGFHRQPESNRAEIPATPFVMITAHGVSDAERQRLTAAGKQFLDTTCPLVVRVHRAALELAAEGRHVIIIGRPGHVEVAGVLEDLPSGEVISDAAQARNFERLRLGVVCQSTTPPRVAEETLMAIRRLNPDADVRSIDTICQPTRDRQDAVKRLLPQIDVMVVVGGQNSNNTRELARLAEESGVPTHHVQGPDDLDPAWFLEKTACGLTAGTSTLDTTVSAVHRRLLRIAAERETAECREAEIAIRGVGVSGGESDGVTRSSSPQPALSRSAAPPA
ncbi:MAG: 4-hydroxy-3-methylbut-2-enyl diphosphate reductase [Planctomycetaceae bacterium]|nr:MAG: 4-hydroxy-3-methylbut-2-enyl diphosphate reductase [Planctomycetaceae bacterium]